MSTRSTRRSTERYSERYSDPTTVSRFLAPTDADKRHRDTETPRHRDIRTFMAESSSNRPSAQCVRRDDLDLTFEQGEAR